MDILDFLNNGTSVPNPNYKKPSKSNPAGSPRFINDNKLSSAVNAYDIMGDQLNRNTIDLTPIDQELPEDASKYGIYANRVNSIDELNAAYYDAKAKKQSALAKWGNAVAQAGLNEFMLGSALGLSNMVDMAVNLTTPDGEDDYTNPVSKYIEDLQNNVRENFAIYQRNPGETWAIGDAGWWAENSVSIASSLSMLIPSTGIVKGSKLLGVGKVGSKLTRGAAKMINGITYGVNKGNKYSKAARFADRVREGMGKTARLENAINNGAEIATTAFLSRTIENYMEARGVYNEQYQPALDKLNAMDKLNPNAKQEFIARNFFTPNMSDEDKEKFINMSNEELAQYVSSKAADKTFQLDYAMLLMDILQFKALNSMWRGIRSASTSAATRIANRNAIRALTETGKKQLESTGWLATKKEALRYAVKHPLESTLVAELSEGFEEAYQYVAQEKGNEFADLMFNPEHSTRALGSYLRDPHLWEQAFWGWVGGVAFQGAGNALGKGYRYIGKKLQEKGIIKDFNSEYNTEEKAQLAEIDGRVKAMNKFVEDIKHLDNNEDYEDIERDSQGKPILDENGVQQYKKLTEEQARMRRINRFNQFATDMTLNSADRGTWDLFKDYITDKNFDKFFEEAGVQQNAHEENISQQLLQKMEQVYDDYSSAINDVYKSVNVENPYIANLVARNITRRKLDAVDFQNEIDKKAAFISEHTDDATADALYEQYTKIKFTNEQLTNLDKQLDDAKTAMEDGRLSRPAYKQLVKEANERRRQLISNLSNIEGLEVTRQEAEKVIPGADMSSVITEYNKFVKDNDILGKQKNYTPKQTIRDEIAKKIELEDARDYNNYLIPKNDAKFQEIYDDFAKTNDINSYKRYSAAADRVSNWIIQQENLDAALDNVINEVVPEELKADLELLKLGHASTAMYSDSIYAVVEAEKRKRREDAEKTARVGNDGEAHTTRSQQEIEEEIESQPSSSTGEQPSNQGQEQQNGETQTETPEELARRTIILNPARQEIEQIDKAEEERIKRESAELTPTDVDLEADNTAKFLAMKLIGANKNLTIAAVQNGINSAEYNQLVDALADQLVDKGVSRGIAKNAALNGLKKAFKVAARRFNAMEEGVGDKFVELADQISVKASVEITENEGEMFANTTIIPDAEFDKWIESFIDAYIDQAKLIKLKGNKTVVNLESLFQYLITNPAIGRDEAMDIYRNIAGYIMNHNGSKYSFIGKRTMQRFLKQPQLFFQLIDANRVQRETITDRMHIAPVSDKYRTKEYYKAIENLKNGQQVTFGYNTNDQGHVIKASISVRVGGTEIGFLSPTVSNTTHTYFGVERYNGGFIKGVTKNADGSYSTDFDEFFTAIINRDVRYKDIIDLLDRKRIIDANNKEGVPNTDVITQQDFDKLFNNPIIQQLITDGKLSRFKQYKYSNTGSGQYVDRYINGWQDGSAFLNEIYNIVYFDNYALTSHDQLDSYEKWKEEQFKNYEATYKIKEALEDESIPDAQIVGINNGRVLYDDSKPNNINSIGLMGDANHMLAVSMDGNIVDEVTGQTYTNLPGFKIGTIGFMLRPNDANPIMAIVTDNVPVNENVKYRNAIKSEIFNLLKDYQDGNITFDAIRERLSFLFSGPKISSNNLFNGYAVLTTDKSIALNIQGEKGHYNLLIWKNRNGKDVEGTGITYIPNGDETKAVSSITADTAMLNAIAEEITNGLTFNRTFYTIKNIGVNDEESNPYMYKKDGKLHINIGRDTEAINETYDSFGDFAIREGAFYTNQQVRTDANGHQSYFESSNAESIFINLGVTSPVEEETSKFVDTTIDVEQEITSHNMTKPGNTYNLLVGAGFDTNIIDILSGRTTGIQLLDTNYYYNSRLKANAEYSKGKIYFGPTGVTLAKHSNRELMRLLLHESLHHKMDDTDRMTKGEIVGDLLETFKAMQEAITEDLKDETPDSDRKRLAKIVNDWLNENSFSRENYFEANDARSEDIKDLVFAEEWLVESLTEKAIMQYLNHVQFERNGVVMDIDMQDINSKPKSLWQKIIDCILKLFGFNENYIENNTILARQYQLLADPTANNSNGQQNTNTDNQSDNNTDNQAEDNTGDNTDTDNQGQDEASAPDELYTENEGEQEGASDEIDPELNDDAYDSPDYEMESRTSGIEEITLSSDETVINASDKTDTNIFGTMSINNMNEYLDMFNDKDKPMIAEMLNNGNIKYVCR